MINQQAHNYHKIYAPFPLFNNEKSSLCSIFDQPQKTASSKIQPYLKVVESLPFAEWEEDSNRNLFQHFSSSAFWYLVSSQYFSDCHLPTKKRLHLRKQAAKKITNYARSAITKQRVQKKKTSNIMINQQWRTEELKLKTDVASSFAQYYFYVQKPRKFWVEPNIKVEHSLEVSSSLDDFQFLNSTVISVVKIIMQRMKKEGCFNSVVKFMLENVKLIQENIRVKKCPIISLNENNSFDESKGQNMIDIEQEEIEIKLDLYQMVRNIVYDLPLDVVIGFLQEEITPYSFPGLQEQENHLKQLYCDAQDTYNFVGTHSALDDQWIKIKKLQEKQRLSKQYSTENISKIISKKGKKPMKQQDLPCQVCFSGDYEDNNLIMICSLCNIAIHQDCIYVEEVPKDNWICSVCEVFGPAGTNLPCPLCPLKGGAMLKTNLRADRFVCPSRHFQQYLMRMSPLQQPKQYVTEQMRSRPDVPLLYNYFQIETYPTAQPRFYEVWIHYSCAAVHNEPYFSSMVNKVVIQGVQNIPAQKYEKVCTICGLKDGVTAKCHDQACQNHYHAECARRVKLVYQEADKQTMIYKVFCPQHRPFEVQVMLHNKRRKSREEIKTFARQIAKCVGQQKFPHRLPVISQRKNSQTLKKETIQKVVTTQGVNRKKSRFYRFGDQPEVNVASVRQKIKEEIIKEQRRKLQKQSQNFFNSVYFQLRKKYFDTENHDMKDVQIMKADFFETLKNPTVFWKIFETNERSETQAFRYFSNLIKENPVYQHKIKYLKKLMRNKVSRKTQSEGKNKQKQTKLEVKIQQVSREKEENIQRTAKSRCFKEESPQMLEEYQKKSKSKQSKSKIAKEQKRYHTPQKKIKKQESFQVKKEAEENFSRIISQNLEKASSQQVKVEEIRQRVVKRQEPFAKIRSQTKQKVNHQKTKRIHKKEKEETLKSKKKILQSKRTLKKQQKKIEKKTYNDAQKKLNGLQMMEQDHLQKRLKFPISDKTKLRKATASNIDSAIYCVCQQKWNPKRPMIQCEKCKQWYHFTCIGMINKKQTQTMSFICEICLGVQTKKTRIKYLQSYTQFFKPLSSIFYAYPNDFTYPFEQVPKTKSYQQKIKSRLESMEKKQRLSQQKKRVKKYN